MSNLESSTSTSTTVCAALFSVIGIGYLFPLTAMTQPVDYWHILFPELNIEFHITSIFMWSNLIFLTFIVIYFSTANTTLQFAIRLVGGFLGQFVILVIVPCSYFIHLTENYNYYFVMTATALMGVSTAFLDSAAIAFAARYPLRVQEGFQLGIGLSSLIGAVNRISTKLLFPTSEVVMSSLLYFYTGALTMLLCLIAFFFILLLPISKRVLQEQDHRSNLTNRRNKDSVSLISLVVLESRMSSDVDLLDAQSEGLYQIYNEYNQPLDNKSCINRTSSGKYFQYGSIPVSSMSPVTSLESLSQPFQSLAINIEESTTKISVFKKESHWWSLLLLFVFALMDVIGRMCCSYRGILNRYNIGIAVGLRFLFIPLLLCAAKGVWLTNDIISILLVTGFGFTHGYIGSNSIVMVSECTDTSTEASIAGLFTSFILTAGLVIGSSFALGLQYLLESF